MTTPPDPVLVPTPPAGITLSEPPLSNHATDATVARAKDYLIIASDGTARGSVVRRSDGKPLGLVQSVEWRVGLDDAMAQATIVTSATPATLRALVEDTTLLVRPAPGYHPLRYLWDWYSTKVHLLLNPESPVMTTIVNGAPPARQA